MKSSALAGLSLSPWTSLSTPGVSEWVSLHFFYYALSSPGLHVFFTSLPRTLFYSFAPSVSSPFPPGSQGSVLGAPWHQYPPPIVHTRHAVLCLVLIVCRSLETTSLNSGNMSVQSHRQPLSQSRAPKCPINTCWVNEGMSNIESELGYWGDVLDSTPEIFSGKTTMEI